MLRIYISLLIKQSQKVRNWLENPNLQGLCYRLWPFETDIHLDQWRSGLFQSLNICPTLRSGLRLPLSQADVSLPTQSLW